MFNKKFEKIIFGERNLASHAYLRKITKWWVHNFYFSSENNKTSTPAYFTNETGHDCESWVKVVIMFTRCSECGGSVGYIDPYFTLATQYNGEMGDKALSEHSMEKNTQKPPKHGFYKLNDTSS